MLLAVMGNLGPYLLDAPPHRMFHRPEEEASKLDGGAAASAVVTFINVCTRLDAILADQTRWDTATHDRLYDSIESVQRAQETFLKEQAESARSVRRPSFQLRPTIANDGQRFVAFFGDITRAGYSIIGIGGTPSEALADFDAAFERAPKDQLVLALKAAGVEVETEETKPKRKNKK